MGIWDSFGKLATLDFGYENIASDFKPQIYANSRNQVEIIISVKVIDKQKDNSNKDKVLSLTADDFYIGEDLNNNTGKASLYLCDRTTGERISSPWKLSDKKGDYTKDVNHDGPSRAKRDNAETTYIKTYLSCSESNITKNFSIGIHIPGIGEFNTSTKGTTTKNSAEKQPGSRFQMPKSLKISTLHPIDYNRIENIIISEGVKKFTDMKYVASDVKLSFGDIININHYVGKSSYSFITIKTKKDYLFKIKDFKRNMVKIPNVNVFGKNDSADIACGRQRSHGNNADNYDITLIFIDSPKCGISPNSSFHLMREHWLKNDHVYYRVDSNDHKHELSLDNSSIPKIDSAYISLVICNYTFCNPTEWTSSVVRSLYDTMEKDWNSTPSDGVVKINVFDEYGNSGDIKIKLDYEDKNYPKVIINDTLEFFN